MANTKEYMRAYMAQRYKERRQIAEHVLGGKCCKCGSTDRLEIDHTENKKPKVSFTRMVNMGIPRFMNELKVCQLLCWDHHSEKSIGERGHKVAKGTHGTLSSYRWCRCGLCRAAWNKYHNDRKKEKRRLKRLERMGDPSGKGVDS